jgi:ribulose-5-phosphate 4-epimerase/fuculose-1-phosphate aldolase
MSPAEQAARVQLAAAYRIFDYLGWTELIYNHITLRLPGPAKHFLINPFGLRYAEVKASNLVRIDLDGKVVGESPWPVNRPASRSTARSTPAFPARTASCTPTRPPAWRSPARRPGCR